MFCADPKIFLLPFPKCSGGLQFTHMNPKDFICPECGSREPGDSVFISTVPNGNDPWSSVLRTIECNQCHSTIPAHLAERWDDLTLEAAQKQWQEIYRDSGLKKRCNASREQSITWWNDAGARVETPGILAPSVIWFSPSSLSAYAAHDSTSWVGRVTPCAPH
jgi:hypothetical protein